jgi:hypothetical protein
MTAEVAVMNRVGVALAADSAVTIGREARKIYTSADKLFQLSEIAPVGVMVYGNASYCALPWETIIKAFRRQLGLELLPRLDDYFHRFHEYLTDNSELISPVLEQQQVTELILNLLVSLRDQIRFRLDVEAEHRNGFETSEISPIVGVVVRNRLEMVLEESPIVGLGADARELLLTQYGQAISTARHRVLGELPLADEVEAELTEFVVQALLREYFGPLKCGIVIAGFGDREYLPSLMSMELEESLLGKPRRRDATGHSIERESGSCVLAFAQQDAVQQFMHGIDPSLDEFMVESSQAVIRGSIDLILGKLAATDKDVAESLRRAVAPEMQKIMDGLIREWSKRKRDYWEPILDTVEALPKDELAAMAESLVNLTKFRRRVTPEQETVGGPIDVAVITKGDGFIWLRRKHYFDPTLNPRFVARYAR